MTYPEVASVLGLLDKWSHLPAYQHERRADIFFAVFLPDVFNRHLSQRQRERQRGIAIDPRLIPEFPLKRREDNGSKKADYLAQSTEHKHAFLIELKTDSASLDKDQVPYLDDPPAWDSLREPIPCHGAASGTGLPLRPRPRSSHNPIQDDSD